MKSRKSLKSGCIQLLTSELLTLERLKNISVDILASFSIGSLSYLQVTHRAPARYFNILYVQYLAVMSSKFIISLSQSANQINGYEFSTFL